MENFAHENFLIYGILVNQVYFSHQQPTYVSANDAEDLIQTTYQLGTYVSANDAEDLIQSYISTGCY